MAKITILSAANVPQGPFTRDEVAQKLAAGDFTLDSLAHVEGLAQWTPLRDVLARIDAAIKPPVPPTVVVPPAPTPAYSYAVTMEPPPGLIYAGFWLRFVAYIIDLIIVGAVASVVALTLFLFLGAFGAVGRGYHAGFDGVTSWGTQTRGDFNLSTLTVVLSILLEIVFGLAMLAFVWLYFALQESSVHQATIGKRLLGIYVTDVTGQRILFWRASGRIACKIVGKTTFGFGFIMAGFTQYKQALHDMIAGTLVLRR